MAEEDLAAAKMQALMRGKTARQEDPLLLQCVAIGDVAALDKYLASGALATPGALAASIGAPVKELAASLVGRESAWGVDETELACWNKVQSALYPTPTEDDPEPEAADVTNVEGWQAEAVKELFGADDNEGGKAAPADPVYAYTMRRVVTAGCYAGTLRHQHQLKYA